MHAGNNTFYHPPQVRSRETAKTKATVREKLTVFRQEKLVHAYAWEARNGKPDMVHHAPERARHPRKEPTALARGRGVRGRLPPTLGWAGGWASTLQFAAWGGRLGEYQKQQLVTALTGRLGELSACCLYLRYLGKTTRRVSKVVTGRLGKLSVTIQHAASGLSNRHKLPVKLGDARGKKRCSK